MQGGGDEAGVVLFHRFVIACNRVGPGHGMQLASSDKTQQPFPNDRLSTWHLHRCTQRYTARG